MGPSERYAAGMAARVLIADASLDYRNAVERLLADQPVQIVGTVADTVALALAAERLRPDVILLDPELPGLDGVQAAARLVQGAQPPAVIFLALVAGEVRVRSSTIEHAGFILKESADRRLAQQILAVVREPMRRGGRS